MYISKRILVLVLLVVFVGVAGGIGYYKLKAWYEMIDAAETTTTVMIEEELEHGFEQKVSKALEKFRQARACFAQKNFECAIKHIEESVEIYPFSVAYLVLGNAYLETMRTEEAIEAYETAINKAMQDGNGKIITSARAQLLSLKEFLKGTAKFRKS